MSKWSLLAGLVLAPRANAQELFLRTFDGRDGLAHERVTALAQAPEGFLWVGTWEGLSRFDGREFTSFGVKSGLAPALVFHLAFDPEGRLWAAPYRAGVARFEEDEARFRTFPVGEVEAANEVNALVFDARGLWVGTAAGVYRARERAEPRFELAWSAPEPIWRLQAQLFAEQRGWIVTADEVLELADDGVRVHAGPEGTRPRDNVRAQATADGRALIVTSAGLFQFSAAAAVRGESPWTRFPCELGDEVVHATALDARGRALLATTRGLLILDGPRARRITTAQGLPDEWLRTLYLDHAGALWLGSNLGGLTCLREPEITSYLGQRGRARLNVAAAVRTTQGELVVGTGDRGLLRLEEDGLAELAGDEAGTFANVHVRLFQERGGDWWLGTDTGAWRVRGPELDLARAEPIAIEGGGGMLGEPFQDDDGRILMGSTEPALCVLDPREEPPLFRRWIAGAALGGHFPRAFLRDRTGLLWIATNDGLWRLRGEVPERVVPRGALAPAELEPRALLLDARGWLWIGTRHAGLVCTREPGAAQPVFERLSPAEGLPSEQASALAEDGRGRLWIGTGRGLVRLEPENGAMLTFTTAEGLAGEVVNDLVLDADGTLWAACSGGLARVEPEREPRPSPPPPCYVQGFEAGGRAVPVDSSGTARLAGLELEPWQRAISARFTAIDLARGEALRFQHRLRGLEGTWSAPSRESSVHYGSLAPGTYRLEVRALTPDGVASATPAEVEFRLLAPLWCRPWFVALVVLALGGLAWSVWRARQRRVRALETIRGQIARDLHDEVGSNLAQIAVLAEVARSAQGDAREPLGEVAELARATRSSMADLVWAIDPHRDTLLDLVQRMRAATANLLGKSAVELELCLPAEGELDGRTLAPDQRRHLLFFFKEALHNVVRHAGARRVEVELTRADGELRLAVRDDGRGFDPERATGGQGLQSLRTRARELGATLRIDSQLGRGSTVELRLPL